MAIFNFVKAGSGSPVQYGASAILVGDPRVTTNIYAPDDRVQVVIPASGLQTTYFGVLDGRYKVRGSGTPGWEH